MFRIYLVRRTSIDLIEKNDFTLKKRGSSQYLAETMTDEDYDEDYDLALLAYSTAQAESLQHS